jgi:hypothetical protein
LDPDSGQKRWHADLAHQFAAHPTGLLFTIVIQYRPTTEERHWPEQEQHDLR